MQVSNPLTYHPNQSFGFQIKEDPYLTNQAVQINSLGFGSVGLVRSLAHWTALGGVAKKTGWGREKNIHL